MRAASLHEFVHSAKTTGRYICPKCSKERQKNTKEKTLSITVNSDHNIYQCYHCLSAGRVKTISDFKPKKPTHEPTQDIVEIPTKINSKKALISNFFKSRGVDVSELDLSGKVITDKKYFSAIGEEVDAIGFVYSIDDHVQAIKWRPADPSKKAFTSDNAARMLYGLKPLPSKSELPLENLIIVEGEADVIALASIGINAYSHPNGAPLKVSKGKIDPEEDTKFSYIWDSYDEIISSENIILATDNDTPGRALKQELARRIGLEHCSEIEMPEDCKDVTDVLKKHGSDALKNLFTNAEPMPLQGVYDVNSYMEQVESIWEHGVASGESTGYPKVDRLFTIKPGMTYIVTGYPGCGKSELLDQLMINLAQNNKWKWAVASFENPPEDHIPKLMEKVVGKNFFIGPSERISKEEMMSAKTFLNDHFVFLEQKDGSMSTMEDIIRRIKLSIARCGTRGAIIDPFNYINMSEYESENIGISKILSELHAFARANDVAVFFVAHPQKLLPNSDGKLPVPKGSHISGSAAWWAKADVGITVHRPDNDKPITEVHTWKVKFKWLGQLGKAELSYDRVSGIYSESKEASWDNMEDEIEWDDIDF